MISLSNRIISQCNRYHLPKSCIQLVSITTLKVEMSTSTVSSSTKKIINVSSPTTIPYPGHATITQLDQKAIEKERLKLERQKAAEEKRASNARFNTYLDSLPTLIYPNFYQVDCIGNMDEANRRLRQMTKTEKIFGVDLEWPPTFIKGQSEKKTSLVQICSANNILLLQLGRMHGFPSELKRFFEDKQVLKSGVNIGADGLKLYRDFGIKTNGLVELRDVAESVKSPKLKISHLRSLRALTGIFLDQNMAKGKVRLSNWSRPDLSNTQIKYAALDAYASYKLYVVLNELRDQSKPIAVRHLSQEDLKKSLNTKKKPLENQPSSASHAVHNKSFPTSTTTVILKKKSFVPAGKPVMTNTKNES
ncbi:uncharacterized protein ATC70_004854 [Mucor velutinosus]|uniref:3'-5' exonuclease n=1 Tax=Mucor velutinosus TaxID=708070 RepID=A0AAN7HK70_9FUNG|nr:hypothetical protein ATC70_004854 [Mucor velutinosus]